MFCYVFLRPQSEDEKKINRVIIFFDSNSSLLSKHGISFKSLNDLDSLGLIKFESLAGIITQYDSGIIRRIHLYYNGFTQTVSKFPDKAFPIGNVILTSSGETLSKSISKQIIPGYLEYVVGELKKNQWRYQKKVKLK